MSFENNYLIVKHNCFTYYYLFVKFNKYFAEKTTVCRMRFINKCI